MLTGIPPPEPQTYCTEALGRVRWTGRDFICCASEDFTFYPFTLFFGTTVFCLLGGRYRRALIIFFFWWLFLSQGGKFYQPVSSDSLISLTLLLPLFSCATRLSKSSTWSHKCLCCCPVPVMGGTQLRMS